jgi:PAS domain S-box-containing protein
MAKKTYEALKQRVEELEQVISDNKTAEDGLQDINKRHSLLFHDLPDPVFIFRESEPNTLLECNQAATEKYGYSREELLKMTIQELHPPDKLDEVKKNIQDDQTVSHEYIHIGKDKKASFVNTHSRRIKYNGEDAQITVVRDITRLKQIEEAFRNSEDRLSNIIEFLPDATFVIDQNKKIIAWNKALEGITDILKEDILGKDKTAYAMAFYEELRPTLADLVEEKKIDLKLYDSIARNENNLIAETFAKKLFKGKGAFVWAAAAPFYDKNGNFLGAIESIRDITELKNKESELAQYRNHLETLVEERTADLQSEIIVRKQAEEKLSASERRLDAIIKTVPDIIYRLDADGRITFISDSVKQYGYQPEKLLKTSVIDLVYHEDKEKAKDKLNERRTRTRKTESFEVRFLTKDQQNISFEIFSVSAEGLYSSMAPTQDTFLGTQGIARDITERKLAEEERELLIKGLQKALENVKTLSGLVPICSYCKKIRDDNGYWNQIESYLQKHSNAEFSHGICPDCSDTLYGDKDWYIEMKKKKGI